MFKLLDIDCAICGKWNLHHFDPNGRGTTHDIQDLQTGAWSVAPPTYRSHQELKVAVKKIVIQLNKQQQQQKRFYETKH